MRGPTRLIVWLAADACLLFCTSLGCNAVFGLDDVDFGAGGAGSSTSDTSASEASNSVASTSVTSSASSVVSTGASSSSGDGGSSGEGGGGGQARPSFTQTAELKPEPVETFAGSGSDDDIPF